VKFFSGKTAIKREPTAPDDVSYRVSYVHCEGAFAMQKDSITPISVQMIIHCGMGVILGALLGLALIATNPQIFQFIVSSSSPLMEMAVFVGFFSFVVGTGATMSGFVFTAIELNALEAKQQTQRVKQQTQQNRE
jgi:NhaP-type Na+/H+ or K+/H+ antiporter